MTVLKSNLTPTPDYLSGAFLTHYFLFDTVLGRFLTEGERAAAYSEYAAIFAVTDKAWLDDTYALLNCPILSQADDPNTFYMLSRATAFYPEIFPPEERFLIAQKSNAMRIKVKMLGPSTANLSRERLLSMLEGAAAAGEPDAVSLLTFLRWNGILMDRDPNGALVRMHRLASWNHPAGILMCLRYGPAEQAERCAAVLGAVLDSPSTAHALAHLQRHYALPTVSPCPLAKALERAFAREQLPRDKMSAEVLRMLESSLLDTAAKRKLLAQKNVEEMLAMLPMGIAKSTPFAPVFSLAPLPLYREEESHRLLSNLAMLDVRDRVSYKPLLLICEDPYVLDHYKRLLASTLDDHALGTLDLSDPGLHPFADGKENAVISLLDRLGDAGAVVCLENVQEIPEERAKDLVRFLRHDCLRRFRFFSDSVCFDLSEMLPVLFATEAPCKELCAACDTVELQPVTEQERRQVLQRIAAEKAKLFSLRSLTLSDSAYDLLCGKDLQEAEALIERAVSLQRRDSDELTLTDASFSSCRSEKRVAPTHFWGGKNK